MGKRKAMLNNRARIEENDSFFYNIYKAKSTLWYFNHLLKNGSSGYNSIKFKNADGVYVWFENVNVQDDHYMGELAETRLSKTISVNEVIDWMIIDEGRLIGGYTIRHYRSSLDEEAKINFDIDFGVKIDDGNDVFKPDLNTPEGAIIMLENYYTAKNLDGVLSCKSFVMEAENLLKARKISITAELLDETADLLKLSLIEDLTTKGFPNFDNVKRSFKKIGEKSNQQLIEEKVLYGDKTLVLNRFWVGFDDERKWKVLNLSS